MIPSPSTFFDDISLVRYSCQYLHAKLEISHVVTDKAIVRRKEGVAALRRSASSLVQSGDPGPFTSPRQTADSNVASMPS